MKDGDQRKCRDYVVFYLLWMDIHNLILGLVSNNVLIVSLTAWMFAQSLKGIIYSIKRKKIDFRKFIEAGGMPSSHAALVAALATAVGIKEGWDNTITAITIILALIVMYDANGIRLAASRHAITLNKMVDELFEGKEIYQKRLKESLGHTITEIIAGAMLGVTIAFLIK